MTDETLEATPMNDDYYRRQAAEAQAQADKSISDEDQKAWLRIAQSWMQLIKKSIPSKRTIARVERKANQAFDDATAAQETHQKRSDESH